MRQLNTFIFILTICFSICTSAASIYKPLEMKRIKVDGSGKSSRESGSFQTFYIPIKPAWIDKLSLKIKESKDVYVTIKPDGGKSSSFLKTNEKIVLVYSLANHYKDFGQYTIKQAILNDKCTHLIVHVVTKTPQTHKKSSCILPLQQVHVVSLSTKEVIILYDKPFKEVGFVSNSVIELINDQASQRRLSIRGDSGTTSSPHQLPSPTGSVESDWEYTYTLDLNTDNQWSRSHSLRIGSMAVLESPTRTSSVDSPSSIRSFPISRSSLNSPVSQYSGTSSPLSVVSTNKQYSISTSSPSSCSSLMSADDGKTTLQERDVFTFDQTSSSSSQASSSFSSSPAEIIVDAQGFPILKAMSADLPMFWIGENLQELDLTHYSQHSLPNNDPHAPDIMFKFYSASTAGNLNQKIYYLSEEEVYGKVTLSIHSLNLMHNERKKKQSHEHKKKQQISFIPENSSLGDYFSVEMILEQWSSPWYSAISKVPALVLASYHIHYPFLVLQSPNIVTFLKAEPASILDRLDEDDDEIHHKQHHVPKNDPMMELFLQNKRKIDHLQLVRSRFLMYSNDSWRLTLMTHNGILRLRNKADRQDKREQKTVYLNSGGHLDFDNTTLVLFIQPSNVYLFDESLKWSGKFHRDSPTKTWKLSRLQKEVTKVQCVDTVKHIYLHLQPKDKISVDSEDVFEFIFIDYGGSNREEKRQSKKSTSLFGRKKNYSSNSGFREMVPKTIRLKLVQRIGETGKSSSPIPRITSVLFYTMLQQVYAIDDKLSTLMLFSTFNGELITSRSLLFNELGINVSTQPIIKWMRADYGNSDAKAKDSKQDNRCLWIVVIGVNSKIIFTKTSNKGDLGKQQENGTSRAWCSILQIPTNDKLTPSNNQENKKQG